MKKILLTITLTLISTTITAMAQIIRHSGMVLTDETCDILCKAAQDKSREMGLDISFAIADADGLPRLFRRFGDALVLSATLVPDKAYTAAITRTATADLIPHVADGGNLMGMNTCDSRITLVPGGFPLIADGEVVGAIGVGGGTKEQDLEIADSVIQKFKEIAVCQ